MKYFLAVSAIIILIFFYIWQGIYLPKNALSEESVIFLVKKGQGVEKIAANLENQELIKNKYLFIFYTLSRKKELELKAGEYEISTAMSISQIVDKIASGDSVNEIITIVEGWTSEDIAGYLSRRDIVKKEDFLSYVEKNNLEGFLFPDTYELLSEDGVKEIVLKMRDNFEKQITAELKEEISSQGKTLFEIITMASLIEKEVQTLEDKKVVSGILWKRMENGMLLQVDAAVVTYKIKGLTKKPICNPGMESIKSAIYPKASPYWFYLSAPDGKTIFSKTLTEHELAIEKYLK